MAYINNVYLHTVRAEEVTRNSEMTTKPVETGVDVSDHIKKAPLQISLDVILTYGGANYIRSRLVQLWEESTKVTYRNINSYHNLYITNIGELVETSNDGGYALEINLMQPQIAKLSTYRVKVKNPVTKKQDPKTATKVKQTTNVGEKPKRTVPPSNKPTGGYNAQMLAFFN